MLKSATAKAFAGWVDRCWLPITVAFSLEYRCLIGGIGSDGGIELLLGDDVFWTTGCNARRRGEI